MQAVLEEAAVIGSISDVAVVSALSSSFSLLQRCCYYDCCCRCVVLSRAKQKSSVTLRPKTTCCRMELGAVAVAPAAAAEERQKGCTMVGVVRAVVQS